MTPASLRPARGFLTGDEQPDGGARRTVPPGQSSVRTIPLRLSPLAGSSKKIRQSKSLRVTRSVNEMRARRTRGRRTAPARATSPKRAISVDAVGARVELQRRRHPDRADVVELLEVGARCDVIELDHRRQLDGRAQERPGRPADGVVRVPEVDRRHGDVLGRRSCRRGRAATIAPWFITYVNRPSAPPRISVGSTWK